MEEAIIISDVGWWAEDTWGPHGFCIPGGAMDLWSGFDDVESPVCQFMGDTQYGELFSTAVTLWSHFDVELLAYPSMWVSSTIECPYKMLDFNSPMAEFIPNMHIMIHGRVPDLTVEKSKPCLMPFGSEVLPLTASYSIHEGILSVFWDTIADDCPSHYEDSLELCDDSSALKEKADGQILSTAAPFPTLHKPEVIDAHFAGSDIFGLKWSCRDTLDAQCGICEDGIAHRISADLANVTDTASCLSKDFANPLARFQRQIV